MWELVGKIVVVETPDITYTGRLVEIGEQDVYIQADTGWIVIPVDKITDITEKED